MSFIIYKSSAGSGKTYTLIKEYLIIVLENPGKFRNILAVTFTNKAANEMKTRVIKTLHELADQNRYAKSSSITSLLPELAEKTGISSQLIGKRAIQVLTLILHNYSEFGICTIDSFVHKIVRTFANDLKLPLNFEVELDKDNLITQSIDLLLSRVGHDDKLTKALVRFIDEKMENEESWHIEENLKKFTDTMLKEDSFPFLRKIKKLDAEDIFKVNSKMFSYIRKFEQNVNVLGKQAMDLINSHHLSAKSFYQGVKGIYKYFNDLYTGLYDKMLPNSFVIKTIDEDKWIASKANVSDINILESIKPQLLKIYLEIQKLIKEQHNNYILYRLIRKHIYPIAVLNEIDKIIDEFREVDNIIHISEFNRRIADIVLHEPVPFIYERLGEKYQHFLVDEFQDTSLLQWQNLLPLFENALGHGCFNLVVGDGKQAIYRWRNGDVEQFSKLPYLHKKDNNKITNDREKILVDRHRIEQLNKNYRSKKEIIAFNNSFFETIQLKLPESVRSIYNGVIQEFDNNNTGGSVHIKFFEKELVGAEYEGKTFQFVIEIIKQLENDGFGLNDITVLCRKNKQASKIARILLLENINVVSSESLLLTSSPEVNFLASCLFYLVNPDDQVVKAEILTYLVMSGRISDQDIDSLLAEFQQKAAGTGQQKENKNVCFFKLLKDKGFDFPSGRLLNYPVYELVEELIRLFELDHKVDPYVLFFLDAVLEFTSKHSAGLMDFLEWWDDTKHKYSIVVPMGLDAVRVMTIHKAKGLEFPVVIYPFADDDIRRLGKESLWIDLNDEYIQELPAALLSIKKADLENTTFEHIYYDEKNKTFLDLVNLLYVAMTRPINRLYIMCKFPASKNKGQINIPSLIKYYLEQTGQWNEEQDQYVFGTDTKKDNVVDVSENNVVKLNKLISADWKRRLLISKKSPEIWDLENPEKNKEWGNLVHTVLSGIRYAEDGKDIIEGFYHQGMIDEAESKRLIKVVDHLLEHPDIMILFDKKWNVKNEAEIIMPNGQTYRPDRLLFDNNEVVIVDYKTGKQNNMHQKQINRYEKILSEMGYDVKHKYIIYIGEEPSIVQI